MIGDANTCVYGYTSEVHACGLVDLGVSLPTNKQGV